MACLWHRCAHGGVLGDDMRVEGVLHRLMEDGVEAVDGGVRQCITKLRMLPDPPVLFQLAVEFLHILRCHQRHLFAAELRLDVVFDAASIPRKGAGADGVLFIVRQPEECEEKLKVLIAEMNEERKNLKEQLAGIAPPEKLTKKQRKLWDYMRLHPDVTEFSTIAKRTGLSRNTVKKHYEMVAAILGKE